MDAAMTDDEWRRFFVIAGEVLGPGEWLSFESKSWCAFTTFESLETGCRYFSHGIPAPDELSDTSIKDGGTWGEPLAYKDLAHLIVPRSFFWETAPSPTYTNGTRTQDIHRLSDALHEAGIPHRCTDLVLEIKLY
jgi:hypothetical protein